MGGARCWIVSLCTGNLLSSDLFGGALGGASNSMAYPWDEVKRAVERVENAQLERWLVEAETLEIHRTRSFYLVRRVHPFLEALGALAVGLNTAVMVLIFNYLLFNWILHINFGF
jgi:hypothetical protein